MGDQTLKFKRMTACNAIDVMRRNRVVMHQKTRTIVVLMPNGRYRYPEAYIDMTPSFSIASEDLDKDWVFGYEMEINI